MTIDERLKRLTERHEALTQSVELLLRQGEQESQRSARVEENLNRLIGVVESLANIVHDHEPRIEGLEEQ